MAFFCPKRKCYVSRETNKRFKGLAKHLRMTYFHDFEPPPGLGKRVGPKGYRAGTSLDRAVGALVSRGSLEGIPKWAQKLAHKVVLRLRIAGISKMKSQVVVHDSASNFATAVDVCGVDLRTKKYVLVEIKYSSHRSTLVKGAYAVPGRNRTHMIRCGLPNTMKHQHEIQARATAKLFCSCFKVPRNRVDVRVLVVPFSGPVLEYPVDL